jgi:pimeloyl-ACP methyl ester carboxylesterase
VWQTVGMAAAGERWLLLHGTPLTPAVWDGVAAHLRAVGPVWCPDVTPTAADRGAQDALARRLLGELGPDPGPLHVVGHSFGGQIALEVALAAPHVRSLAVLCSRDTPFPAFAAAAASVRRGEAIEIEAAVSRWFTPAELGADGPVVSYARSCLRDADRAAWADALDAIARYDRTRQVGRIAAPATLVAAELDQVATPAAMAALAGRLPRGSLHVLAGAAHMSPFADPATLARLLLRAARA